MFIKLDCCTFADRMADDNERDADEIDEENEESALDWLQDRTSVIKFNGGVIIQNF